MWNKIKKIYVGTNQVRPEVKYNIEIWNYKSNTTFSTSSYGTANRWWPFSLDGTKRYSWNNGSTIYEYTLSTPYDPTSMVSSTSKSASGQIHQVYLSPDGSHLAFASYWSLVWIWEMTTPNDLTTATNYKTKSFSSPVGVWFKPDGTIMYVGFYSSEWIKQYSLSTPRDITTATQTWQLATWRERWVTLSSDWTILIRANDSNSSNRTVYQYTLSTPWDITTATQTHSISWNDWFALPNLSLNDKYLICNNRIAEFYEAT